MSTWTLALISWTALMNTLQVPFMWARSHEGGKVDRFLMRLLRVQ